MSNFVEKFINDATQKGLKRGDVIIKTRKIYMRLPEDICQFIENNMCVEYITKNGKTIEVRKKFPRILEDIFMHGFRNFKLIDPAGKEIAKPGDKAKG
jgi:hypothetical protein